MGFEIDGLKEAARELVNACQILNDAVTRVETTARAVRQASEPAATAECVVPLFAGLINESVRPFEAVEFDLGGSSGVSIGHVMEDARDIADLIDRLTIAGHVVEAVS